MPLFIKHRVNRISQIGQLDPAGGAEIDLRANPERKEIYLAHDLFESGDPLSQWLAEYRLKNIKGPLILNVKEDGLEERVIQLLASHQIENYFFLDSSIPTVVRLTEAGVNRFALRLSSHEPLNPLAPLVKKANWLWIDCFQGIPIPLPLVEAFRGKLRLCLVSPELQGKDVRLLGDFLPLARICDCICTKDSAAWKSLFNK